jgi:hypothetical protein
MNIDIKKCRSLLLTLNKELRKKCGDSISIQLGDYAEMISQKAHVALYDETSEFHLLLCLNRNNACISTISCKINNGYLEISSKTDPEYEGRKYNLLLRCAIVLLAPYIFYNVNGINYGIDVLLSRAINPISILLMAKYFRATNDDLNEFMHNHGLRFETLTLEDMQTFYDELNEIPEFETDEEELLYLENHEMIGNPVSLFIHVKDPNIIMNTQKLFSNLAIRCPDSSRGGRRKRKNKNTLKKTHGAKKRTLRQHKV